MKPKLRGKAFVWRRLNWSLCRGVLCGVCSNVDWCCLDSKGDSIGILIMWDCRVVEKVEECVGEFLVVGGLQRFSLS